METLCLTFWGSPRLFSIMATPFYLPISSVLELLSSLLTNTYHYSFIIHLFYYSHPGESDVVFHCGFDSISLMTNVGEHLLQVLTGHLYILKKCLLRSFVHFLIELFAFLLLSYKKSLYVLEISHFSDIWFPKFFSHS